MCKIVVQLQAILPIHKFPREVLVPDIYNYGPDDGHFCPTEYFKCPKLDATISGIKMSLDWKDQVMIQRFLVLNDHKSLNSSFHVILKGMG